MELFLKRGPDCHYSSKGLLNEVLYLINEPSSQRIINNEQLQTHKISTSPVTELLFYSWSALFPDKETSLKQEYSFLKDHCGALEGQIDELQTQLDEAEERNTNQLSRIEKLQADLTKYQGEWPCYVSKLCDHSGGLLDPIFLNINIPVTFSLWI